MKVSFTGTQDGMTETQKESLRCYLGGVKEFHHGDCVGADEEAHEIAVSAGVPLIVIHPPSDSKKRAWCGIEPWCLERPKHDLTVAQKGCRIEEEKPYLERNRDIVDSGYALVAAPKGKEVMRSGTWSTVRYARKEHKLVVILS